MGNVIETSWVITCHMAMTSKWRTSDNTILHRHSLPCRYASYTWMSLAFLPIVREMNNCVDCNYFFTLRFAVFIILCRLFVFVGKVEGWSGGGGKEDELEQWNYWMLKAEMPINLNERGENKAKQNNWELMYFNKYHLYLYKTILHYIQHSDKLSFGICLLKLVWRDSQWY